MKKHSSGLYYKKLKLVFLVSAFFITFMVSVLTGFYISRLSENNYKNTLSITRTMLEEKGNLAFHEISTIMTMVVNNQTIKSWSQSSNSRDFYLKASHAQQALRTYSSLGNTHFSIYVLMDNQDTDTLNPSALNVLSSKGSYSTVKFLEDQNISTQEFSDIQKHFDSSVSPCITPHYNADGQLDSIYYWIKGYILPQSCIYLAEIPVTSFLGTDTIQHYWLSTTQEPFLPGSLDEASVSLFQELQSSMNWKETVISSSKYYISNVSFPELGLKLSYLSPKNTFQLIEIFLFLGFILILFTLLYLAASRIANHLYRPIYEVLKPDFEKTGQSFNEFELLNDHFNHMKELNKSLIETQQTTNRLLAQKYYQTLLTEPAGYMAKQVSTFHTLPENGSYCVGLICFSVDTDSLISDEQFRQLELEKNLISQQCMKQKSITFVPLSIHLSGIIIQAQDLTNAKTVLSEVFANRTAEENEESSGNLLDSQIILSPVGQGLKHIHDCYQKALKITEYLPMLPHDKIITYEQIAAVEPSTYSYSLSTETKLIQEIIHGDEHAITMFDQLIRENLLHKELSMEVLQNFIYSLIGMISRVFQELKETPDNIIGHPINYEYWYTHWADSTTITEMKTVISQIITERNRRTQLQDESLKNQMLTYIHENFADNIMLNDLAEQFNISPKYCSILFKQLSASNFKDYLNHYRIEQAKRFIRQNPQIKTKDLSTMTGFNSSNTFIRVFSKYTGVTPQKYAMSLDDEG